MGSSSSCPPCPQQGLDSNKETNYGLFNFSWTTIHPVSVGLGGLIATVLITMLICSLGFRCLQCFIPKRCLDIDSYVKKPKERRSRGQKRKDEDGVSHDFPLEQIPCRTVSIPTRFQRVSSLPNQIPINASRIPVFSTYQNESPCYGVDLQALSMLDHTGPI